MNEEQGILEADDFASRGGGGWFGFEGVGFALVARTGMKQAKVLGRG